MSWSSRGPSMSQLTMDSGTHSTHSGSQAVVPDLGQTPSALAGKRTAMVVFSSYPADPRPRRAIDALLKEGMGVDLICLEDEKAPRREQSGGLSIYRVPITHRRGGKFTYAYNYSAFILISTWIFALRALRRGYDLVYVHNMPDVLVVSAMFPKLLGAKVILDLHDPMPELMTTIFNMDAGSTSVRLMKWLEKWSMACAHRVLTVNVACKRIFSSRSCRPEKITVVMNSPDEGIFRFRPADSYPPAEEGAKRLVIMYHGSLVERNGLDLAVEALSRVRARVPNAELRVYGRSTPFLEQVLADARNKGLENAVHYLGPKRLEELTTEIESCDVGVIPNQRNAFTEINTPTRIFEYLALGKPVIAPRTPGIQDYFGPDALMYFDSGDAEDLARAIEYADAHRGEAMKIAQRGQQVYLTHAWPQERQTLLNAVKELVV